MGNEKAKASDGYGAEVVRGGNNGADVCEAPWMSMKGEIIRPNGERIPVEMKHNAVMDAGKGHALNNLLGSITASTAGAALFLHSATTASNNVWANISGSQVHSYGASMPAVTFASTYAAGLATATASFGFSASTQTVSGAGLMFYTSASCATSITAGAGLVYAYGHFSTSRQVQSGDTLNVTLSVSLA
jgi:hypothetical protein